MIKWNPLDQRWVLAIRFITPYQPTNEEEKYIQIIIETNKRDYTKLDNFELTVV